MTFSDAVAYGPVVAELLQVGRPDEAMRRRLASLDADSLVPGRPVRNRSMAECCLSGLWLLHDFLDESHRLSQEIGSSSGSYWHAVMHRREPDYSNAKYWFRRVGRHPIFEPLREQAGRLAAAAADSATSCDLGFLVEQTAWDPMRFVDLCESAGGPRRSLETVCRQVADVEWRLLFDYCFHQAFDE